MTTTQDVAKEIDTRCYALRATQQTYSDPDAFMLAVGGHMAFRNQIPAIVAGINAPNKTAQASSLWQQILAVIETILPTLPTSLQSILSIVIALLPLI